MSEPDAAAPAPAQTVADAVAPEAAVAAPEVHGGELLRQAREAAGLHVAALAVALKVPVRQVEALEQGAFDRLPDATFVRALAGSVCRHLHLDPQPVLARLPASRPQPPRGDAGINEPFQRPGDGARASLPEIARRPAFVLVLVLLLGAVLLMALPALWPDREPAGAAPAATGAAPAPQEAASIPAPGASASLPPVSGGPGMVIETVQPALPVPPAPTLPPAGSPPPPRTTP